MSSKIDKYCNSSSAGGPIAITYAAGPSVDGVTNQSLSPARLPQQRSFFFFFFVVVIIILYE